MYLLEFVQEVLRRTSEQRVTVKLINFDRVKASFSRVGGEVLTNRTNVPEFNESRCADVYDLLLPALTDCCQ